MQEILQRTFERCTERMGRVWAEQSTPKEPEFEFRVTFTATESVGNVIKEFIAGSPTRNRSIASRPLEGGGAVGEAVHKA